MFFSINLNPIKNIKNEKQTAFHDVIHFNDPEKEKSKLFIASYKRRHKNERRETVSEAGRKTRKKSGHVLLFYHQSESAPIDSFDIDRH